MTEKIYLTDRQTAARYGVKKSTIYRWLMNGSGFPEPHRFSDKCTRWALAELEVWDATRIARTPRASMLKAAEKAATARRKAANGASRGCHA